MSVLVIAEIGSAWVFSGDWSRNFNNALRAIHVAKEAGADIMKFQWCSARAHMAKRRNVDDPNTYWRLSWPQEWHELFAQECQKAGIEYMCTVYLPDDVAAIAPYVQRFKIASLEMADFDLANTMAVFQKPVIISTGCQVELPPLFMLRNVHLLHCTAAYPAPLEELNLAAIDGQFEGYSDHSANVLVGAVAVGAGASIIEVHFRLDQTPKGNPDYAHSHSPFRFKRYVENVRQAELMMGDGIKKIQQSEEPLMKHRVTA